MFFTFIIGIIIVTTAVGYAKGKVKLNETDIVLVKGQKKQLIVQNAKKMKIIWASKSKKIVSVSQSGICTYPIYKKELKS